MNLRILGCTVALYSTLWAADTNIAGEIRSLFTVGAWDQALNLLQQVPAAETNPATRELLAMAYLYTANRLDAVGHLEKAKTLTKQIVDSGGKAHFFVSQGRDKKRESHLVEATPGELVVTAATVEFQPQDGSGSPIQRWEKKDITECALNPKYGKSSNSFHVMVARNEVNLRPLHFSSEESTLICSLVAPSPSPAVDKKK